MQFLTFLLHGRDLPYVLSSLILLQRETRHHAPTERGRDIYIISSLSRLQQVGLPFQNKAVRVLSRPSKEKPLLVVLRRQVDSILVSRGGQVSLQTLDLLRVLLETTSHTALSTQPLHRPPRHTASTQTTSTHSLYTDHLDTQPLHRPPRHSLYLHRPPLHRASIHRPPRHTASTQTTSTHSLYTDHLDTASTQTTSTQPEHTASIHRPPRHTASTQTTSTQPLHRPPQHTASTHF